MKRWKVLHAMLASQQAAWRSASEDVHDPNDELSVRKECEATRVRISPSCDFDPRQEVDPELHRRGDRPRALVEEEEHEDASVCGGEGQRGCSLGPGKRTYANVVVADL